MSGDSKLFLAKIEYNSGRDKFFVCETRKDARDIQTVERKKRSVSAVRIIPAKRGPSNVKV